MDGKADVDPQVLQQAHEHVVRLRYHLRLRRGAWAQGAEAQVHRQVRSRHPGGSSRTAAAAGRGSIPRLPQPMQRRGRRRSSAACSSSRSSPRSRRSSTRYNLRSVISRRSFPPGHPHQAAMMWIIRHSFPQRLISNASWRVQNLQSQDPDFKGAKAKIEKGRRGLRQPCFQKFSFFLNQSDALRIPMMSSRPSGLIAVLKSPNQILRT